jgi:GNAT superfamily N-acetyltransferase
VEIRDLDPARDRAAVAGLYARAADYVRLESGREPDDGLADAFFAEVPPGGDRAASSKLGLFVDGGLAGIADLGFGFPAQDDAFLGLLLLAPAWRGRGLGRLLLEAAKERARARGAPRIHVAVLDGNPRGCAFWEREGFRWVLTREGYAIGERRHTVHRLVLGL